MLKTGKQVELRFYSPHKAQRELHTSGARFCISACGRRWGKTLSATNWQMDRAIHDKGLHWWVAPVYYLTETAYNLVKEQFKEVISYTNKTEMRLELVNGSTIEFKSADKYQNLVSVGLKSLVVDECGKIKDEAWYESLRPTLTDYEAPVWLIGTPKGKNWYYKLYSDGLEGEEGYSSFNFPSMTNPYLKIKEIDDARKELPDLIFRQEYLAEFVETAMSVFKINDCIDPYLRLRTNETLNEIEAIATDVNQGSLHIIGVDWAKYSNWTVFVVMETDKDKRRIVGFKRFSNRTWKEQQEILLRFASKFKRAELVLDTTGVGDSPTENIINLSKGKYKVSPVLFTGKSKIQMMESLALSFERQDIVLPKNIKILIEELRNYEYEVGKTGNVTFKPTYGFNDDCVDAIALANYRAREGGVWSIKDISRSEESFMSNHFEEF